MEIDLQLLAEIRRLPDGTRHAAEAARELGVQPVFGLCGVGWRAHGGAGLD